MQVTCSLWIRKEVISYNTNIISTKQSREILNMRNTVWNITAFVGTATKLPILINVPKDHDLLWSLCEASDHRSVMHHIDPFASSLCKISASIGTFDAFITSDLTESYLSPWFYVTCVKCDVFWMYTYI